MKYWKECIGYLVFSKKLSNGILQIIENNLWSIGKNFWGFNLLYFLKGKTNYPSQTLMLNALTGMEEVTKRISETSDVIWILIVLEIWKMKWNQNPKDLS